LLTWLRCPNSESIIARVLDHEAINALDHALDRASHALTQQLVTIALTRGTDRPAPRSTATELARRIALPLSGLVRDAAARALRIANTTLVVLVVVAAAPVSPPAAAPRPTPADRPQASATCIAERGLTRVERHHFRALHGHEKRRPFRRCVRPQYRQTLPATDARARARAGAPLSSHAMLHICCTPPR
jgi:hypothetical protein